MNAAIETKETPMPPHLASYDLVDKPPAPYQEFLEQAENHGWSVWVRAGEVWNRLPNTTLVGDFPNIDAAVQALKDTQAATARATGRPVTFSKWVIVPRGMAKSVSDETQPA